MKKLLLSMVALTVFTASYATSDLFKKNKERKQEISANMKKNSFHNLPSLKSSSTLISVPQLTKQSWWDDMSSSWNPSSAQRLTYQNDRLVSEIQMSYTGTDTFSKTEYTYDANGRYSAIYYKTFDQSTHSFISYMRTLMTYSANNSVNVVSDNYDQNTNLWTPSNRYYEKYDDRGNMIGYKNEMFDGAMWVINNAYSRSISYYNNTSKMITEIDSSYDGTGMIPTYKTTKDYDANGRAVVVTASYFNGNIEEVEEIDSILYDANNLPTTLIAHDSSMQALAKLTNLNWGGTFNQNIDIFQNEPLGYELYEMGVSGFVLMGRSSKIYPDNYGSEIYLDEAYTNNTFVPDYRYSNLNNNHFDLIESSEETYNVSNASWETMYGNKNIYQYDINNNKTEMIGTQFYQFDSAYHNINKYEYFDFLTITAGINSNYKTIETKVYPNPSVNGTVNITLKIENANHFKFEIIDLNGRVINAETRDLEKGLNTFEFNDLNKGMYFVVVSSDDSISRTKLIVK